ncbi:sensor histidine kinase [Paenibacillus soyae]|uniref:sensor histidine kinase n=1 Tax=Paenibacillus soyae TaxID=2969249 RepID=UPI0027D475B5|nr:sensor histidine kinase [Paenibacillus soyae]
MKQVVLNLFQNAVQHTDPVAGTIHLGLKIIGAEFQIDCEDNGAGIPPEHLPHIFGRFYRSDFSRSRARGGTGLGLAITKSIIEAHRGRIEVESKVGAGTRFIVSLPASSK